MNRYLIILGFVGATLFSACSTSDDFSIGESPVDKEKEAALIFEASQNSEVPITLGTGESRGLTRAPLEPGDVIDNLAVFCLATGTQTGVSYIPTSVKGNNWSYDKNGELGGLLVRMNNVSASVSSGIVSYTGKYYYPEANWMKYNYYAYYPKQDDSNVTFTSSGNQLSVSFTALDGVHDVIWGRAYPETNPDPATDHDPYCAKYFLNNTNSKGPQFKFEHKLVQFKFFVIKAADLAAVDAEVTDMYISNAIKQLTLIVANKKDSTLNGKVTPNTKKKVKLSIKTNTDPLPVTALTQVDAHEVGYLMLPAPPYLSAPDGPADANGFIHYHIGGKVKFSDSTEQNISIDMVPPQISPGVYGFEPGKKYNIYITVKRN